MGIAGHRGTAARRVRRVFVSILLGLLTSAAVAWAIALADIQTYTFVHSVRVNIAPEEDPTYIARFDFADEYRPAFTRVELASQGPERAFDRVAAERVFAALRAKAEGPPPIWTAELYPPRHPEWPSWLPLPPAGERYTVWSARAAGWPMLCLCSRTTTTIDGRTRTRGAIRVVATSAYKNPLRDREAGMLPLLPAWPGLAVNSALYGSAWWLLLFAPGAFRRFRRRSRGCCVACGYDLRGDYTAGCPECGWGRTPAASNG